MTVGLQNNQENGIDVVKKGESFLGKVKNRLRVKNDLLKTVIIVFCALAAVILIFGLGVSVGGMKAQFSYRWAENYNKNFGGPANDSFFLKGGVPVPPPGDFSTGHGTFGQIIQINNPDLIIKGPSDVEKIIVINGKTVIEKGNEEISQGELNVGENAVVIGSPNDKGQIDARLIRVFASSSFSQ